MVTMREDNKDVDELWNRLRNTMRMVDATWCLFGDFNEVRTSDDRLNIQFNNRSAGIFNEFIRDMSLSDIPMGCKRFTRIDDNNLKFSKLDRFLVDEKFLSLWQDLMVIPLDRKCSDRCPIMLRDKFIDFGPKPFRVFDAWWEEKDVDEVVKRAWLLPVNSTAPDKVFRDRLKNVKLELRK
ncbi:RNA-directed DNA polymerase, eukaryota [Tanacetum coccineum]